MYRLFQVLITKPNIFAFFIQNTQGINTNKKRFFLVRNSKNRKLQGGQFLVPATTGTRKRPPQQSQSREKLTKNFIEQQIRKTYQKLNELPLHFLSGRCQ